MYYFLKRKKFFQEFFIYSFKLNKALFTGLFLFYVNGVVAADCLKSSYSIELEHVEKNKFIVKTQIYLSAKKKWDKDVLNLVYYPKRYQDKLPYLHDLNHHRVYPKGFKPSYSEIIKVQLDGNTKKYSWQNKSSDQKRIYKTLLNINLTPEEKKRLKSGQNLLLDIESKLIVPEKFGAFSYYRNQIALKNAWFPYVYQSCGYKQGQTLSYLPPHTLYAVKVRSSYPVLINDHYVTDQDKNTVRKLDDVSGVSIRLGRKLRQKKLSQVPWLKFYHYKHINRSYKKSMQFLAQEWQSYIEKTPQLSMPEQISMSQTPMRRFLVKKTESMAFVSDRLFKLNGYLHKYHYIPLVHAWFYQMFIDETLIRENETDYRWVADALAWYWTSEFLKDLNFKHVDARKMPLLRMFSFLPVVDLLIYSPQFAFVDTFYNNPYPWDYNRDDPVHFYDDKTWGRSLVEKMNDWLGEGKTSKVFKDYLESSEPLKLLAKNVYKGDIDEAYRQWQFRPPKANYKIAQSKTQRIEKNRYQHQIALEKDSEKRFKEPVEIRAIDKKGQVFDFEWFDSKQDHQIEFESKAKLKKIYLDPQRRLSEWQRHDNTKPAPYKFVLEQMLLDYDVNENVPLIFLGGVLRKKLGGYNRYRFSGFYLGENYGFGLGYSRLFGRAVDGLRLSHGASISANFSRVTQDNVLTSSGNVVGLTSASNVTSLGISYFFGNQLSFTNPLSGGGGSFSLRWGSSALWADHDYLNASHGASWVLPIKNINHLLAFRYSLSLSSKGIPSQIQSRLGGPAAIKGISFNDEQFQGRYRVLGSLEYRHFLLQDIDINLGLFRIRDIQGAFGLDAGNVTATVQDQAEKRVNPGALQTGFADLWNISNFTYGANYGLRFHIDYFGVNPSLIRFDAARTLDDNHGGIKFYLGFDQSF